MAVAHLRHGHLRPPPGAPALQPASWHAGALPARLPPLHCLALVPVSPIVYPQCPFWLPLAFLPLSWSSWLPSPQVRPTFSISCQVKRMFKTKTYNHKKMFKSSIAELWYNLSEAASFSLINWHLNFFFFLETLLSRKLDLKKIWKIYFYFFPSKKKIDIAVVCVLSVTLSLFGRFNQCYGVLGVLDLLHGTDDRFRNSRSFSRHVMLLSFTSARALFPDFVEEEETKSPVKGKETSPPPPSIEVKGK